MSQLSFNNYIIVSCGTLNPELNYLRKEGFLDVKRIFYTKPGLHDYPVELEKWLISILKVAKKYSSKIIIIYGSLCYVDSHHPEITVEALAKKEIRNPIMINIKNCIDAIASKKEREEISKGEKIYWLTPGWIKYRNILFKDWDVGKINETFPMNDKAVVLDGINFFDKWSEKKPEELLEFSGWMGLPVEGYKTNLNRLKKILINCVIDDLEREITIMKESIPPHSISPTAMIEIEEKEDELERLKKVRDKF
ncbi:MAG: hypothetical protein B6D56_08060 [Candidatus Omnitrophica bacterium 4484_70.1]|nr:MAG: hypothetical protein B6D56_08060 [Candidatus Omnitrophica bacterium 4484_70.1]